MKILKHVIVEVIWCGYILNTIFFPIAYARRDKVIEGSFLWGFLHEGNLYGDPEWRPKWKKGFWRALNWAWRNPLHNKYRSDMEDCSEVNFSGEATCKENHAVGFWRTFKTDAKRSGKVIDWEESIFGKQDIHFSIIPSEGTIVKGFRKSKCIPFRFLFWIVIHGSRFGYEDGKKQFSFIFSWKPVKGNLAGYQEWKKKDWKIINA